MDIPLGRTVDQPSAYAPECLAAIPRQHGREAGGIDANRLVGYDRWTAWEFVWMDASGRRSADVLDILVPAGSPNLFESKSLKLFLNSCYFRTFKDSEEVQSLLVTELSRVAKAPVEVWLLQPTDDFLQPQEPADYRVLSANEQVPQGPVEERLAYHQFRSLCPVTGQPDWASVYIHYRGAGLSHQWLEQLLAGYSTHQGFHEQCVEQICCQLAEVAGVDAVSVTARFLRRGGIDINPWRTTDPALPGIARRTIRQ